MRRDGKAEERRKERNEEFKNVKKKERDIEESQGRRRGRKTG